MNTKTYSDLSHEACTFSHAIGDDLPKHLFNIVTHKSAEFAMYCTDQNSELAKTEQKFLSTMVLDATRLYRCHLNARRLQLLEEKLKREEEKTMEQVFEKFTDWTKNPAVRKALILDPMEGMRLMRKHYGLPPRPEDPLVEKENSKPSQTSPQAHSSHQSAGGAHAPRVPPSAPSPNASSPVPPAPSPAAADEASRSEVKNAGPIASPSPGGEGRGQSRHSAAKADEGEPVSANSSLATPHSSLITSFVSFARHQNSGFLITSPGRSPRRPRLPQGPLRTLHARSKTKNRPNDCSPDSTTTNSP